MRKYKNMIQFVTICDDFNGKLMSYDTVNIPKCAQGSILHVGSWVIIDKEICLVQREIYGREFCNAFCTHDIFRP